jgi:hypothetical protein
MLGAAAHASVARLFVACSAASAESHQHAICLFAQLDRCGKTMAEIQIKSARHIWDLAEQEHAKPEPQQEVVTRLMKL